MAGDANDLATILFQTYRLALASSAVRVANWSRAWSYPDLEPLHSPGARPPGRHGCVPSTLLIRTPLRPIAFRAPAPCLRRVFRAERLGRQRRDRPALCAGL